MLEMSSLTTYYRGIFPLVIMFIGAENMFSLVCVKLTVKAFIDPYHPGRSGC
jgi:hypothetical protein